MTRTHVVGAEGSLHFVPLLHSERDVSKLPFPFSVTPHPLRVFRTPSESTKRKYPISKDRIFSFGGR